MNARDFALFELDRRRLSGLQRDSMKPVPRDTHPPTDPREYALAERLTIGTAQNLLLLRHLLEHHSGRPHDQIEPLVVKILLIALYQLRFMDRIPASAAVDEAVEQTRRFRRTRATGFVNAVLRNATRNPEVPLPDPTDDPSGYATIVLSHPPELFSRLIRLVGIDDALKIAQRNNREPPTLVRLFKGVRIDHLEAPDLKLTPHEQAGMCVVESAKRAQLAEWAERGLAQVQDATSARVVGMMDLRQGLRVFDCCAGLGTKTLQICDALGAEGSIVAMDVRGSAIAALRRLAEKRGITNLETRVASRLDEPDPANPTLFDRILIDAPCSNSGVLARRPEARYSQSQASVRPICKLQRSLLGAALPNLAPGGLLIYSTCSIWPEENERQIEWFVAEHPGFELVSSLSTLPSLDDNPAHYHDGGFTAVLRKL